MNKLFTRAVVALGTGILVNEVTKATNDFDKTADEIAATTSLMMSDAVDSEAELEVMKARHKTYAKLACGLLVGSAIGAIVDAILTNSGK